MCMYIHVNYALVWYICHAIIRAIDLHNQAILSSTTGGVITDQAEADEDTSMKERLALAVGKFQTLG